MVPTLSKRRDVLRGLGIAGAVGLVGVTAAAAEQDEEEDEEREAHPQEQFAALRLGHFAPGTSDVDVYLNKGPDLNPAIRQLGYAEVRPGPLDAYAQLPPGLYDVAVASAGEVEPALTVEGLQLEAGFRYTTLAIGDGPDLQAIAIVDAEDRDSTIPSSDEAELSFVHVTPDVGPIDVTVGGEPFLEDIDFRDVSDYFAFEPGDYTVGIESNGQAEFSCTMNLREGTRMTAYIAGSSGQNDEESDLRLVRSFDGSDPLADAVLMR